MAHPTGVSKRRGSKLDFDCRLMVNFAAPWSRPMRDCWCSELDDVLGLSAVAGETLPTRARERTVVMRWLVCCVSERLVACWI